MKIILNKEKTIRSFFILFFILLLSYFLWDMALIVRNSLISQGYGIAINELITNAKDERCQPLSVRSGEKDIQLINIECLEQATEEQR